MWVNTQKKSVAPGKVYSFSYYPPYTYAGPPNLYV